MVMLVFSVSFVVKIAFPLVSSLWKAGLRKIPHALFVSPVASPVSLVALPASPVALPVSPVALPVSLVALPVSLVTLPVSPVALPVILPGLSVVREQGNRAALFRPAVSVSIHGCPDAESRALPPMKLT